MFSCSPNFHLSPPRYGGLSTSPCSTLSQPVTQASEVSPSLTTKSKKSFVSILQKSQNINFFPLDSWWLAWRPAQSLFSTSTSTSGTTSSSRDTETQTDTQTHKRDTETHTDTTKKDTTRCFSRVTELNKMCNFVQSFCSNNSLWHHLPFTSYNWEALKGEVKLSLSSLDRNICFGLWSN